MVLTKTLRRPSALALAALLLVASIAPAFIQRKADAYGLVTTRFVQISNSAVSATGVEYDVSFDLATAHTVGSIAIQFCSNTPIIGDSCTAPAGFDIDSATEVQGAGNDLGTPGTYTKDATETVVNRFVAAVDTASADSIGDTAHIVLSGVTNPSGLGSFYARAFTYTTADGTGARLTLVVSH